MSDNNKSGKMKKYILKAIGIGSIIFVVFLSYIIFTIYADKNVPTFLKPIQDDVTLILVDLGLKETEEIIPVWKPVIYLYSDEDIEVDIQINGTELTTTYPLYEDKWSVSVKEKNNIIDKNGREYNYLYWEGLSEDFLETSKGFIVSKDNYIGFLEDKLAYIGLTDREACDFISYWLPYMNEFEYCLVSFQMENYAEQVKLNYSVIPDNELRVFVAFKGLDEPIDVEAQDLSYYSDFERAGFTVVEWGGTFLD